MHRYALAGVLICMSSATLQAQVAASRSYTLAIDLGIAGAPLGEAAKTFGMRAIPGAQYGIVIAALSESGNDWGVRAFNERYRVKPDDNESSFGYSSTSIAARRSWHVRSGDVPVRFIAEAGWRHYRAESTIPNFYTAELEHTELSSNAGFLGLSYGVHFRSGHTALTPQLRLEASYPDIGGGDGRSRLHAESDLGFRASIGFELQLFKFGSGL